MTHASTTPLLARALAAAALLTTLLTTVHTAQAQAVPEELPQELPARDNQAGGAQWGAGLGAGIDRKVYRDFDNDVSALPLLMYENRHISFFGATLDYKLPQVGQFSFRLRARYAGDGYEAKDSPYLAGMAERKGGLWLGGAAIWQSGLARVSAEALAATGDAEGKRIKLEVSRGFSSGNLTLTPRIAANWYDDKFVDYYYGVRADEVRAGRADYKGEAATNAEVGLRFGYAIKPRHNVFVDVSASTLGSGIKDSTIVARSSDSSVKLGYLYAF